jgi:hypothetical protein
MAAPNGKKQIHTAGIIIIGDEVLGGKVRSNAHADAYSAATRLNYAKGAM